MPAHTPPLLADDDIAARLSQLPHWQLSDGHLCRSLRTACWKSTLMVVNTIGHLAEAAWHHPDLQISYNRVEIKLMTHSCNGISAMDFELALQIEQVVGWQPGTASGALTGTPDDPRHRYIVYDEN